MKFIVAAPGIDDLLHLLRAWRFWLLGAVAGALIGAGVYTVFPPAYRALATVNVDFHMEQAWPESTDREQFYYLERETRKLEEIARSDAVLQSVASDSGGMDIRQLREAKLKLSQPGSGGWHFYADDRDAEVAADLASSWAQAFAAAVQTEVAQSSSPLEQYITAEPTQMEKPSVGRSVGLSAYLLSGAALFLALAAFLTLFVSRRPAEAGSPP